MVPKREEHTQRAVAGNSGGMLVPNQEIASSNSFVLLTISPSFLMLSGITDDFFAINLILPIVLLNVVSSDVWTIALCLLRVDNEPTAIFLAFFDIVIILFTMISLIVETQLQTELNMLNSKVIRNQLFFIYFKRKMSSVRAFFDTRNRASSTSFLSA